MNVLFVSHTSLDPQGSGSVKRNFFLWQAITRDHGTAVLVLDRDEGFQSRFGGFCSSLVVLDTGNRGARRILRTLLYILTGWSGARQWHVRKTQKSIDALCRLHRPDVIHLTTPLLRRFTFPPGVPVVADAHNVEHENLRRMGETSSSRPRQWLYRVFSRRVRSEERTSTRRCEALLVSSDRDRELFLVMAPGVPVTVVPNGVDTTSFVPGGYRREPHGMVFTGVLDYPPNAEGILAFLRKTFPIVRTRVPDARLVVVGPSPSNALTEHASADVVVTGRVPDVRPYLASAAIAVVPLSAGGGTRLKILEAMAMGTPVVSTSIGCEGLDVRHGDHLLIADTPEQFAGAITQLMADDGLRARLSSMARDLVCRAYDWEISARDVNNFYSAWELARRRGHGVPRDARAIHKEPNSISVSVSI